MSFFARAFARTLAAGLLLTACALSQSSPSDDHHDGLPVGPPQAEGLDPAPFAALDAAVARGDYPKTTSVLVVRHGRLVHEGYFGEGSPELLNNTRSATKSITALGMGEAIRDGTIVSVHAPAFPFLADLRPFRNDTREKEAITIEDMLTMSSALDCNDDDDASPGNEDNMHPQPNWSRWAVDLPTMKGYRRDAAGLGPWRYCTTNAFLLGQVLARATRTPADRYIERTLLRPLGISKWQWSYSPAGEPMTGGGLLLRSRDFAKIAAMLVDHGRWQGRKIVPASWIDAAFTARRHAYPGLDYGYFFWEHTYKGTCGPVEGWYMAGNGGNAIVMLRSLDAALVVTRENYNTRGMHQQTTDLIERYLLPAFPCARSGG